MVMLRALKAALVGVAVFAALGPSAAQEAPGLPGGATSLQETYQDWLVICGLTEAGKLCSLSQQQAQQNGQRVLAIELTVTAEGAVSGNLVLPFGLALAAGATLQVDDQSAQSPMAFSTCFPAGCVVPLTFDAEDIAAMRSGEQLKVNVRVEGTTEPTTLAISLRGFSAALDRTQSLAG
jgi:invasion protein IalB